jgi:Flp pilus assembly protein TadB
MLRRNQWHLKDMPVLTYVDQFDFITPLSLEECSQRLSNDAREKPQPLKTIVYEVSQQDAELVFGAKYAMNQSAWYLAGQIKAAGNQNQVSCYTGIPVITLTVPFIFLVIVLTVVGITNHLSLIALIALFVAVLVLTWLVGMRYLRQFRQTLERGIRKLLS